MSARERLNIALAVLGYEVSPTGALVASADEGDAAHRIEIMPTREIHRFVESLIAAARDLGEEIRANAENGDGLSAASDRDAIAFTSETVIALRAELSKRGQDLDEILTAIDQLDDGTTNEGDEVDDVEPVADAIAAAAPALNPHVRVPASHRPRPPAGRTSRVALIASGTGGGEFVDREQMLAAVHERIQRNRHHPTNLDGQIDIVGQFNWRGLYPESHRVHAASPEHVYELMHAAQTEHRALVAAGGIPGPAEPRYDQVVYGQNDRPVASALLQIQAIRGRITWVTPPTLDDIIVDSSGGAIDTMTAADDLTGGGTGTKTVQTISQPGTQDAVVRALPLQFKSGNFVQQFHPEYHAAWLQAGMSAWARHADELLLQDIKSASTKYTNAVAELGALRDLKAQVLGQVAEMQDRMRDYDVPLVAIFPAFLPAMLVVDMARQVPGDDAWRVNEAAVRAEIASWGVTPYFAKDSIRGRLLSTPTQPGGTASPRSAGFDADVEWALFPAGTFAYLDGGTLDLGVVRDSTLNALNQFQTFFEGWEGLAKLGAFANWTTSSLCASGTSAAATTSVVCSPQGS